MLFSIAAILLLLLISAITSGSETAMTGASRERLHLLAKEGNRRATIVEQLLESKERLIGALLIGNNAVNILASALTAVVVERFAGPYASIVTAVILTPIVVTFSEVLPKTYAIRHPETMSMAIAPVLRVVVAILTPFAAAVQMLVNFFLFLFRVPPANTLDTSLESLRGAIALGAKEGGVNKQARDMLGGVLDLSAVEVGEIMTHRRNMATLDADLPVRELVELALASPHTRLPVWRGDSDSIIGVLHIKDLMAAVRKAGDDLASVNVDDLCSPPWFVPDTTPLSQQLLAFRQKRSHLALVVDEYGALLGLVTLEDILEEIVGDIADEKDIVVAGVNLQPDNTVLVEGSVTLRDLNRQFDWNLPDDDAATIAGLVIHEAQRIPKVGQQFSFHGFTFEIMRRQRNRITLLRITPPLQATADHAA
ncbi:MAG: HlyC/CorC family transporter [Geminicoccaceae bacterium]